MKSVRAPLRTRSRDHRERGSILILVTVALTMLLGFLALAFEAGSWYLVRAEISKSVDAGALMGAKSISNPHVEPRTIAEEFSAANFPDGYLGTPDSGSTAAMFVAELVGDRVSVEGQTDVDAILAQLFGTEHVSVRALGVAQMKNVEILLVLDRSGSMAGQPMADLKVASKSFIDFFAETQEEDRVGLVSFATSVRVDRPLGPDFVDPLKNAINAMNAVGATNPSDALARAVNNEVGFTDQANLPADRRRPQFIVFFSDGRPTAFRDQFVYQGNPVDAVGCVTGNCEPWEIGNTVKTYQLLGRPDVEQWLPTSVNPRRTGDGRLAGSACGINNSVRWMAFDTEPVPGYAPTACNIPYATSLASHVCDLASSRALARGDELKGRGITIYTIGLGAANPEFLEELATGPDQVFYAPSSDQLRSIFQKIAKQIKLRMVQ